MAGLVAARTEPRNSAAWAGGPIEGDAAADIGLQVYWDAQVPLGRADLVERLAVLGDNIYALTASNRAFALHAGTGLIRWSVEVAPPGQTVLGPTHSDRHAVFTTPTRARLFNQRTGHPPGEARALRGVLTEVRGDLADINIGTRHGVTPGTVLIVRQRGALTRSGDKPFARLSIQTVHERDATGRLISFDQGNRPQPGDEVVADVALPITEVPLPFPASCAAVSDGQRVYVGAANQRLYCLAIVGALRLWETMTPGTVSAAPVLDGKMLFYVQKDGQAVACDAEAQVTRWTFRTEGPLFARPLVTEGSVYVASSDRSLYALNRPNGARRWRARFDAELFTPPGQEGDVVFQYVPGRGLHALAEDDGTLRWTRPEAVALLARVGDGLVVVDGVADEAGQSAHYDALARLDPATGEATALAPLRGCDLIAATARPPAIFLGDRLGRVICLRSASDRHLTPEELADVLGDDSRRAAAAEVQARLDAERQARQAQRKAAASDPFASRSTAPPAAGTGLVPPPATTQPRPGPRAPAAEDDSQRDESDEESDEDAKENP